MKFTHLPLKKVKRGARRSPAHYRILKSYFRAHQAYYTDRGVHQRWQRNMGAGKEGSHPSILLRIELTFPTHYSPMVDAEYVSVGEFAQGVRRCKIRTYANYRVTKGRGRCAFLNLRFIDITWLQLSRWDEANHASSREGRSIWHRKWSCFSTSPMELSSFQKRPKSASLFARSWCRSTIGALWSAFLWMVQTQRSASCSCSFAKMTLWIISWVPQLTKVWRLSKNLMHATYYLRAASAYVLLNTVWVFCDDLEY